MFGKNATLKRELSDGQLLYVQEVFRTIQGEGPHAGLPATFVRLWGCHLKCYFCDTDFESNKQAMLLAELLAQCKDGLWC
jgi:organic radical activating enzyme